jgi:hypothetical protein
VEALQAPGTDSRARDRGILRCRVVGWHPELALRIQRPVKDKGRATSILGVASPNEAVQTECGETQSHHEQQDRSERLAAHR